MPLLEVENLQTHFRTPDGINRAVDGVSFSIEAGETLAVVGESGCGKSVTAMSILRLIPEPPGKIAGAIRFKGRNLLDCSTAEMRQIRGNEISMIFQEPMTSLNPAFTIGSQLGEVLVRHRGAKPHEAREQVLQMLRHVRIPAPEKRIDGYPHEFSGGMRQRVVIALALCAEPDFIVADEPTTALDVSVQAQIISLIKKLGRERGMAVMLVTHDMGVIAETADRVAVMYAGRVAEIGPVRDVVQRPLHPYAKGLMGAIPTLDASAERLVQIPGSMPRLSSIPRGCAFNPRCGHTFARCFVDQPVVLPVDGRGVACHLYETESAEAIR
jgi:peptide/nickel transport system ATP-binding protein